MSIGKSPHALLRGTFDLLNAGDIDGCLARMSEDFRMYLAGGVEPMVGKDAWLGNIGYLRSPFPDFSATVDDAFGAADRVVCLMALSGAHRGEFLGVPPTGSQVSFAGYEVYRVVDDTIGEERILADLHALMSQLS